MPAEMVPAAVAAVTPGPRAIRSVVGVLDDGTPFYAPIGEVVADGNRVTCHLCGRAFRSVAAHLAAHGWAKQKYCEAFGLERGQALEGSETRKLRAASFSARLVFDPAVRDGSAAGRERARRGELTRAAADAARGRPFPEQRRRKAAKAAAAVPRARRVQANRERASQHVATVAADVAHQNGYPDFQAFVLAHLEAGASLAAISRAAGLHKDWLSRHLGQLDPVIALTAREQSARRHDGPWLAAVRRLGFSDLPSYLRDRHHTQHWTVSAIAAEAGFSPHSVASALRRHGLEIVGHATKRHTAQQRAAGLAAVLGYATVASYIEERRTAGWTWNAISAESGQPQTWLRRQGARSSQELRYEASTTSGQLGQLGQLGPSLPSGQAGTAHEAPRHAALAIATSALPIPAAMGEDVAVHPEQAGRLVGAAAAGDAAAWKEIVESFSGLVWSIVRGYRLGPADAADVFQTVWLRLAEHLDRLRNPGQVGAWLATTARHESLRVARGNPRVILTDRTDLLESGLAEGSSPEQALLDAEQAALDADRATQLWRALGQLAERCQKLLRVLSATPPPSYAEVAAALDVPVGSIGPTRARCLEQLRRRLAGHVSQAG